MKIKRILIANRGEIAVRIMKTARLMNIETVAVKTAVEPNAMYLSSADIILTILKMFQKYLFSLILKNSLQLHSKQMPMLFILVMDFLLKMPISLRNVSITK